MFVSLECTCGCCSVEMNLIVWCCMFVFLPPVVSSRIHPLLGLLRALAHVLVFFVLCFWRMQTQVNTNALNSTPQWLFSCAAFSSSACMDESIPANSLNREHI
uniref:Uncharacterized protein n=1 Tax=Rhipicephalus zambeziensis TaxID=60191 RepID=A0A224YG58_9ACAR